MKSDHIKQLITLTVITLGAYIVLSKLLISLPKLKLLIVCNYAKKIRCFECQYALPYLFMSNMPKYFNFAKTSKSGQQCFFLLETIISCTGKSMS
jgi:hypothetical protein